MCTKIKGEPIYEIVRSVGSHEELVVFYLLERIEDDILTRIQNTIYRQTMDSILEGQSRGCDGRAAAVGSRFSADVQSAGINTVPGQGGGYERPHLNRLIVVNGIAVWMGSLCIIT